MKKAKVFLSAIAVLAVVGGALAFKAKNFSNSRNVYCLVGTPGTCVREAFKTTIDQGAVNTTDPCNIGGTSPTYYTETNCNTQRSGTVYVTDAD